MPNETQQTRAVYTIVKHSESKSHWLRIGIAFTNRDGSISASFEIRANPYLTSDTAWGAIDTNLIGPKFGLQYKEGMPLTMDPQFIDYDTKEIKYSIGCDFAYGFNDVRNLTWSTGLNA